jgi:hypothetical protein
MPRRRQMTGSAWACLLLGSSLLIGPWIWPLCCLRGRDWGEIFTTDVWITIPLMTWMVALALAGLALIVLAFRRSI